MSVIIRSVDLLTNQDGAIPIFRVSPTGVSLYHDIATAHLQTALGLLGFGVAYWLVYPRGGDGKPALRFDSLATRLAALAGVAMLVMAAALHHLGPGLVLSRLLLAMAVLTLLGVACSFALCRVPPATVQDYRVRATRMLSQAIGA